MTKTEVPQAEMLLPVTIRDLVYFARKIEEKLLEGDTLKEISRWSYHERSKTQNRYPYLAVQRNRRYGEFLQICPSRYQLSLRSAFVTAVAPNTIKTPRYVFVVTTGGVQFYQNYRPEGKRTRRHHYV